MTHSQTHAAYEWINATPEQATGLVAILLLHSLDDTHGQVDVGDTVEAFLIHLLPCRFALCHVLLQTAVKSSMKGAEFNESGNTSCHDTGTVPSCAGHHSYT